jgi:hypothetical protein
MKNGTTDRAVKVKKTRLNLKGNRIGRKEEKQSG